MGIRRRTFFAWHSWIGLTGGLLLFIICWSGTAAVFSHELDWLADKRLRAPPAQVVEWQAIAQNVQSEKRGWQIIAINAPLHPGFAAEVWIADPDEIWHRVWADPATGKVIGTTSYFNVQRFFRSFHMSLFISGWRIMGIPYGYWLVGLSGVALAASFISSLLFYRRFWRGFLKLETRKGARVLWSDIHKLTGLWSLWFIALIATTGIWYLAEWKVTSEAPMPDAPAAEGQAAPALAISELVRKAEQAYPALEIRSVVLGEISAGLFEVQGQDGAWLTRDRGARVWLDARDGKTIAVQRAAELRPLHRWIEMADPLHFGNFGGLVSKAVWFLLGVGLSGLCLTGAYLQAKRQQRHSPVSRRTPIMAAYLATAFTLLASVWFGYQEMLSYGQEGNLPEIAWGALAIVGAWILSAITVLVLWVRALR